MLMLHVYCKPVVEEAVWMCSDANMYVCWLWIVVWLKHGVFFMLVANKFSSGSEGLDEVHPDSVDGYISDERTPQQPRSVRWLAVQSGQVIHEHSGTPQDMAGVYGSISCHAWQLFWSEYQSRFQQSCPAYHPFVICYFRRKLSIICDSSVKHLA